ncbi:LCP family protein [Cytobacillus spongiae]|jgi:LCP family protein required for cell wall assembly|uniref:LCP family protein n=1 Tax=Cytobacillus spongiae TaxID=2901381 RepID=UPI001F16EAF0|nr:LCP family protein [Cytobacillus spongiae]UII56919.1 LCP family protein [Cytobacillus spongiae]
MRSEKYKKKNKKRKTWKITLFVCLLLVAGLFVYSYLQYKQGVSQSLKETEVEQVEYEFKGKPDQYGGTNVLLIGSDARGKDKSRSDTIMIAQYHPEKGTYKMISIMRDTYVDIPGHGMDKINVAFALGGPDLLRQTIKDNFDVDIQYYSVVDFKGFVQLIDEAFPDGVEIDVEKEMSANIGVTLQPGMQRLDGEHLLGYVRFRMDAVGDFGRVQRQQQVMKKLASDLSSIQTLPKLPKLVGVVQPFINTNLQTTDMLFIGKDFITGGNRDIDTLRIPVDGAYWDERIGGGVGLVLAIDLEQNKQAIHDFLAK